MFRLLLLLSAALFTTLLIGGRDHGQQRFGLLGVAEADRASAAPQPAPQPVAQARAPVSAPPVTPERPAAPPAVVPVALAVPAPSPEPAIASDAPELTLPEPPVQVTRPDLPEAPETVAEPEYQVMYVTGNAVNVREGPSTQFTVVGRVVRDDAVEITEAPANGWVRIRIADGGAEGYVAARLLTDQNPYSD